MPLHATTLASLVSAGATTIYALVSAVSLWLLSRQMRDARRFGAAPALYALLKELEVHMVAVRRLGDADDAGAREVISRYLEFFERIEHLRSAGVLPRAVLRRAFGPALRAHLNDRRFTRVIEDGGQQYEEVLTLSKQIDSRDRRRWRWCERMTAPAGARSLGSATSIFASSTSS